MMTVLLALLAIFATALLALVGTVARAVITDDVKAWTLELARRYLKRIAKEMGDRAEECEEQWLADFEATPGITAKVRYAINQRHTPRRFVSDREASESQRIKCWFRAYGWIAPVALGVAFVGRYPIEPRLYPAYWAVMTTLAISTSVLAPYSRTALAFGYDLVGYRGRVGAGSLTTLYFVWVASVLSTIPAARQAPNPAPSVSRGSTRPVVEFIAALPRTSSRNVAGPSNNSTRPKFRSSAPPPLVVIPNAKAVEKDGNWLGLEGLQHANLSELPVDRERDASIASRLTTYTVDSPTAPTIFYGLTGFDLTKIETVAVPSQPIPHDRNIQRPNPPTNVRVIVGY